LAALEPARFGGANEHQFIQHTKKMSRRWDSNPRPTDYKSVALPTELLRQFIEKINMNKNFPRKKYPVVIFGKAKVSEFDKYNNFDLFFFKQKKATRLGWLCL
jgi:hypothetical protein